MNKILVTFIFPTMEKNYEMYIPINKKIGTIKHYFLNSIGIKKEVRFIDRTTGIEYDNNILVKDSMINNGTKIVVM